MKISLIFVTNRSGAIEVLKENLDRQTFRKFEVIIADDLFHERKEETKELLKDYEFLHFFPRQKEEGEAWNLNKAYNDALNAARQELVVCLQDYIWIPANGLERFIDVNKVHPDSMITGVGHKAEKPDELPVDPKEKMAGLSEIDDRVNGERGVHESDWTYYELNWASCPRSLFPSFEEDMDKYYGGENQIVALKFSLKGGKVYIDRSNECVGYNQALFGRPDDWEEKHHNKDNRLNKKIQSLTQALT